MAIEAVIFDLDGTLLDTKQYIVRAYHHVCTTKGLEVITEENIQTLGGAGLIDTYRHFCPDANINELCRLHNEFQENNPHLMKIFPDTLSVLQLFRQMGLRQGIVTARGQTTYGLLKEARIAEYFTTIITCNDCQNLKPHQEGLLLALDVLKLCPEQAIYVGDMQADIQMGRNAGTKTIGVAGGFSTDDNMQAFGADYVIHLLTEIPSIIYSLNALPG